MLVYITDISIPLDLLQPMQASAEIEAQVGPADTGTGFGWRDLEIQSESEDDQKYVVMRAHNILKIFGYDVATNMGRLGRGYAHIRTRTVDPEAQQTEPEVEQPRGLIPPGVEE